MVFKAWENIIQDGTETFTDYSRELAKGAARGLCRAWTRYPNNVFTISPVTRGVMKSVCSNLNEPIPETVGGSAPNGVYEIHYEFGFVDKSKDTTTISKGIGRKCTVNPWQGSISRVFMAVNRTPNSVSGRWSILADGTLQDGTPVSNELIASNSFDQRFTDIDESLFSYVIVDCNPPDDQLPNPVIEPVTIVIQNNESTEIIQEDEYNVTIPVTNNTIELGTLVDIGGVKLSVDIGGITFGGGDGNPPPGTSEEGDDTGSGGTRNTYNENNYKTVFPPATPEEETPQSEEEAPEVEDLQKELSKETIYIGISIVRKPQKGRGQIYRETIDADYFAGYIVFNLNSGGKIWQAQPIPIRKQDNLYEIPEYATGYRTYAINGATIKVREIVIQEDA